MPIKLTSKGMKTKPKAKVYSPRFFDTSKLELTGTGGKAGLLSEHRNPKMVPKTVSSIPGNPDVAKKCERIRNFEYNYVPLYILSSQALDLVDHVSFDCRDMKKVACDATGDTICYIRASAHSLTCDKDLTPVPKGVKHPTNLALCARLDIVMVRANDATTEADNMPMFSNQAVAPMRSYVRPNHPCITMRYTKNVASSIRRLGSALEGAGWLVNHDVIDGYIDTLSVYDMVCERSRAWQEHVTDEVMPLIESLRKRAIAANASTDPSRKLGAQDLSTHERDMLKGTIAHLENYPISLNQYRDLYTQMSATMELPLLKSLCRENLNIMLSDLMEDLKRDEPQLARVPLDPSITIDPAEYNTDQADAIRCDEPLALVASAAGTGKTKTIMGRMDYMVDTGIEPSDILVITFTNVAADEVRQRNRKMMEARYGIGTDKLVKAMTIDSLVFSIYHQNWPDHILTSNLTLGNALEVYFPNDPDATTMQNTLSEINDNKAGALTKMNRFVEDNLDRVCQMLATVKLVTLELADIICYHMLQKLTEPAEVASKHIIMDEVQDTSILQFIFVLRYVQHHKESLFMVGDGAQTLFEFRFANPRAINVMEASGTFKSYKLQTNYRSRQEILEIANPLLDGIEANQIARLSLRANDLTPVTQTSFQSATTVTYCRSKTLSEFEDNIEGYINHHLVPYIDDCFARGQQVAILARTNRIVIAAMEAVEKLYPDRKIVRLSAARAYDSTVLSFFVKKYWNSVQFMPKATITKQIVHELQAHMEDLVPRTRGTSDSATVTRKAISAHIAKWAKAAKPLHVTLASAYNSGTITAHEFLEQVKKQMFEFESEENSVRQSLEKQRQAELNNNSEANDADIILSTIHSAKGRQWDNVVVIYRDKQPMPQDEQRLYYVALTRACQTEYVLAYGTTAHSNIETIYKTRIAELSSAASPATP